MRRALPIAAVLLAWVVVMPGVAGQEASAESGFRARSGGEASRFVVPSDMRLVSSMRFEPSGLTRERYQQYHGAAQVLGAQITVHRDESGVILAVVGSHYPDIASSGEVRLGTAAAERIAELDVGRAEQRIIDLMIDPENGRHFFRVESRSFASRWFHWIDAVSGQVLKRYNAINSGEGTGAKGDTKDLTGLTSFHGSTGHGTSGAHYDLFSADSRQRTYDVRNKTTVIFATSDADDIWDLVTSDRESPGQPAFVDAHYYANVTDDYLLGVHGLDWIADCGYTAMLSVAHFDSDYNNAFWTGTYTVYGDGDGVDMREFSAGLDVVAHEHAHGVTDCTSDLIYQNESGALNESFSDIVGNSVEFFANEPDTSNCVKADGQPTCADWWLAEDVDLRSDAVPGFRNMSDPEEDADPDHYSEYIVTSSDNGGVHSNSGIPNHAYYLLVNGGQNASCAEPLTHNSAHCSDGDTQDNGIVVTGIGLADAERIFFLGFTALPTDAAMCQARAATEAAADAEFGAGSQQSQSTTDAWVAVGLTDLACGGSAPTPTPTPAPPPDGDGDGVPDESDNCPAWPNADQSLPDWPVQPDDPDCDGFATDVENFVGTLSGVHCAATAALDDEDPDAGPTDNNDDQFTTLADVLRYIPVFNSTAPGPPYDARFDLNNDGFVTLADVLLFIPFFNKSCTP